MKTPRTGAGEALWILMLWGLVGGLRAEVLIMRDGRQIEGQVIEADAKRIRLSLGVGEMVLPRAWVREIRPDEASGPSLTHRWEEQYAFHPRFVPPGYETWAERLRSLEVSRAAAVKAQEGRAGHADRRRELEDRIAAGQRAFSLAVERLTTPTDSLSDRDQRALALAHNRALADLSKASDALRIEMETTETHAHSIAQYLTALTALGNDMAISESPNSPAAAVFWERLVQRQTDWRNEIRCWTITPRRQGNTLIVRATLNDKDSVHLIVDTGASLVCLTEQTVSRLGLQADGPSITIELADGRRIEAATLTLNSLEVEGARATGVLAAVLSGASDARGDGLLGMSFLNHFQVSLDPRGKTLTLEEFTP